MGAAGWTRAGPASVLFCDLFESLLGTERLNYVFCSGLFPGHFLYRFLNRTLVAWGFQNSHGRFRKKTTLHRNRVSGLIVLFFPRRRCSFFAFFCCSGDRFENRWTFTIEADPELMGCWWSMRQDLVPVNNLKQMAETQLQDR